MNCRAIWGIVLLWKLGNKSPPFNKTLRIIYMFTNASYWYLFWAKARLTNTVLMQSMEWIGLVWLRIGTSDWLAWIRKYHLQLDLLQCMDSSSLPCKYIPHFSHPSFNHPEIIWWRVWITKLLICSFLWPPAMSSWLGPNIFLSTLSANRLDPPQCELSSFTPLKKQGKIIILYTIIFIF
jgi:hypothetical protein